MSRLLASEPFEAAGTNTPLAFETRQPDGTFQRFLRLDGERAYYLGPGCDTCGFVFVRQGGANRSVSTTPVADELPQGVDRLDRGLLDAVGDIVPSGRYRATLVEIVPELVRPGEQHDYFAHEQVAIWGIDPFWGLPQHPKTEYYRGLTRRLDEDTALFEFVVPMFPRRWLDAETIDDWRRQLVGGARPTALALGLLEAQEPALLEHEPNPARHLCLAHFLLDGHHRVAASAQAAKPVTILSFLSLDESGAPADEVDAALAALTG